MKQVICLQSTTPHKNNIAPVNCVVKDCIYTPIFRGPIGKKPYDHDGKPMPDDYYQFLETGKHSYHHVANFTDIIIDDEDEEEVEDELLLINNFN